MSTSITRDEWLSEFERLMHTTRPGDPGLSTEEIADALGVGMHRVNRMMREAFKAGRLQVGKKPGLALDGRKCMVPCYQLTPMAPNRRETTTTTDEMKHARVAAGRGDTHRKAAKRQ